MLKPHQTITKAKINESKQNGNHDKRHQFINQAASTLKQFKAFTKSTIQPINLRKEGQQRHASQLLLTAATTTSRTLTKLIKMITTSQGL